MASEAGQAPHMSVIEAGGPDLHCLAHFKTLSDRIVLSSFSLGATWCIIECISSFIPAPIHATACTAAVFMRQISGLRSLVCAYLFIIFYILLKNSRHFLDI